MSGSEPASGARRSARLPWQAKCVLLSLPLPFLIQVGPLLLTPIRIALLILVFPALIRWLGGKAGRVRVSDLAIVMLWLWTALSFILIEGISTGAEAGGIWFIETIGAYFVARAYIRSADQFRAMVRMIFAIVAIMLPFALYETMTGDNIMLDLASSVWSKSYADVSKDPRWGFDRVAGVFAHPILFGIFCGTGFALTYYVLGYHSGRLRRGLSTFLVGFITFLSLSSGPLAALVGQLGLMSWDKILRRFSRRWVVLVSLVGLAVLVIELFAERSTPQIFISYFAFDKNTAFNRLRIWEYGSQSVLDNFWFGIGNGDWVRPIWMSDSIDMFWLVAAMKNGFPAGLMLHLSFLGLLVPIALRRNLGPRASAYRTGYIICMVGFYLGGWTVHYWKAIYVLYLFMLGSGAWLLDASGEDEKASETLNHEPKSKKVRYSRDQRDHAPTYARTFKSRSREREDGG